MKFDVIIVGGGLVGASLALALKDSGLKIALVESRPPPPLPDDEAGTAEFMPLAQAAPASCKTWAYGKRSTSPGLARLYNMAVFGDDNAARIDFSAYDIGCPELAFILENRQLQAAVWDALKRRKKHIRIFCPAQCASVTWTDSHAELQLADGNVLQGVADRRRGWPEFLGARAGAKSKLSPFLSADRRGGQFQRRAASQQCRSSVVPARWRAGTAATAG